MENPGSQDGENISQGDSGAGGTCSVTTTVGGMDTSETGGSPDIQRTVGPDVSHPASGMAANGAVAPRRIGVHPKAGETCRACCLLEWETSEEFQLDGAWPWSRLFSSKPNVQWFGTQ